MGRTDTCACAQCRCNALGNLLGGDEGLVSSPESHLMAFAADKSRIEGNII